MNSKNMQALRQIVSVKDNTLSIVLPDDFKAKKVEVIVLPIEEPVLNTTVKNSERFANTISKETALKIHNHLNNIHDEWDRDIY